MRPCFPFLFPLVISVHARIHALCAARARGRCSVSCAHACVPIERSPPIPISRCPSTTPSYRYTQLVPSIHRNIEEIALPFVLQDRCFFQSLTQNIHDFVFNSVLKCKFTLLSTTSRSEISMNIDLYMIIRVFKICFCTRTKMTSNLKKCRNQV